MRVMIIQPMAGKTDTEILRVREAAERHLIASGHEVINTYFSEFTNKELEGVVNKPLYYLSKSLQCMSTCDAVYLCAGWDTARGCQSEYKAAKDYGLTILY